jgi:hypothetical protein
MVDNLCPQCQTPMKLHRRHVGKWYRLYICPGECKDFEGHRQVRIVSKNKINYRCPVERFEACAMTMKPMKCGECKG